MKVHENIPLKNFSWVKIGGICKKFIEAESDEEFSEIISEMIKNGEEFEILGFGANTLISDDGINHTVIKNISKELKISDDVIKVSSDSQTFEIVNEESNITSARHSWNESKGTFRGIKFTDIYYEEPEAEFVEVEISAGYGLPNVTIDLISKGVTGLQWFAGIPGNIGGSIFNNIHGGSKLLSDYLVGVTIVNPKGEVEELGGHELGLAYNETRFRHNKEYVVKGRFKLQSGNKDKARGAYAQWAYQKRSQPKNSLGSVFGNITIEDKEKFGFPTTSIGYIVEHELKLSGYRVGDAMIYPESNNFIVNVGGNAKASDYLSVMKKVYTETYEKFGIKLHPEIFFKGFSEDELSPFTKN